MKFGIYQSNSDVRKEKNLSCNLDNLAFWKMSDHKLLERISNVCLTV